MTLQAFTDRARGPTSVIGVGLLSAWLAHASPANAVETDAPVITHSGVCNPEAVQPGPASEINVPLRKMFGASPDFVTLNAGGFSNDSIVVVLQGRNRELYGEVRAAVQETIKAGCPVTGIILADGEESVEVWADGMRHSTYQRPESDARAEVQLAILRADARMKVLNAQENVATGPDLAAR